MSRLDDRGRFVAVDFAPARRRGHRQAILLAAVAALTLAALALAVTQLLLR